MIGVCDTRVLALVDCVEKLENILTDELIITIHFQRDSVALAVIVDCIVDTGKRALSSFFPNDLDPFLWDFVSPEVLLDEYSRSIIRMVINDNHPIIAIILIEDALQIIDVFMIIGVIPGGYHHAHTNLMRVLIDIVFTLEIFMLFLSEVEHCESVIGLVFDIEVGI